MFNLFHLDRNRRDLLAFDDPARVYSGKRFGNDGLFERRGLNQQIVDTLAEAPQSSLSGVARVLVHAGKLNAKVAEDLVRTSKD